MTRQRYQHDVSDHGVASNNITDREIGGMIILSEDITLNNTWSPRGQFTDIRG